MFNIGEFLTQARRILLVSRKPTWQEYMVMSRVTGIGIIAIGVLGAIITLIFVISAIGR
jgi:protein transport protein SEC61 subunit gamma-like protein